LRYRKVKEVEVFKTTLKLAGVTFPNPDGTARQDILGVLYDEYWTEDLEQEIKLELRPEPDNKYDSNAVAVFCTAPEDAVGQIGYVPAEQAAMVGTAITEGRLRSAEFDEMGCARGNRIWARLHIEMRSEHDSPEDPFGDDAEFLTDEDGTTYRVIG